MPGGLSPVKSTILHALRNGVRTTNQLEGIGALPYGGILRRRLYELREAGLVETSRDPSDRRRFLYSLTNEGKNLANQFFPEVDPGGTPEPQQIEPARHFVILNAERRLSAIRALESAREDLLKVEKSSREEAIAREAIDAIDRLVELLAGTVGSREEARLAAHEEVGGLRRLAGAIGRHVQTGAASSVAQAAVGNTIGGAAVQVGLALTTQGPSS
ncbi:MAG: DNA-binding transcriptional regulator, MarR family [Chloroflexi bacterium]|jgi:DNA-binding MarR family transcriptional regulator|nr:MAG: DNA-binding transcriptional regulator, MarR family [Chloroflexota bacterium]